MVISWTSLCFFLWVVLCAVEAGLPQYWTTSSSSTASLSTTSGLRSSRSRGNQQTSVLPPPLDTSTERQLAEMRLPWQVKVLQKVWSVSPSSSSSPSEASSATTNGGGGGGSNTDHSDGSSASSSSSPSQGGGLGTSQMTILNEEGDELTYFPSSSANRRSNPFLLLLTKTQQSLKKLLTHPKLIAILIQMKDWSQDNVQKMIVLMKNHKSTALLAGKIVFGVYLSVLCLRRLLKWYHGITQHELLLDHNDYLYQSFGGVYDHIGSSFLSTCNASYVTNSQSKFLQQSYQRLTTSLNRPCFPHTMKSYTQYIHRDIIVLLKDVVMLQTTSVIVLDSSNAAVSSASMPSTASSQPPRQADSSTVEHINDSTAVITTERTNPAVSKAVERQALEEGQLQYVQQLQRGILYLQYRQSDVYLRMIRLILLTTVNQIEELLQYWTQVVMKKSRTFRLFFLPTFLFQRVNRMRSKSSLSMSKALHKIQIHSQDEEASTSSASSSTYPPQQDASNEDIDMMLSHLNAREKVVLLQNLRDHMYAQLGEIQTHLDSAALIMTSLGKHFEDSLQRSQPNSDDVQVKNQRDGKQLLGSKEGQVEETQTWQDLRDWVEESSSLASHALSVISMRSKLHHAPSNHSPHFMQMFANPNTTVVHEASISVVDNNQTIATVNATDAIAQNGTEAVSSRWTFFNIFPRTSTLPQVDSALPTNVSSGIAVTATRQRSTAWAALTYPFSSAGTFVSNAIVAPTQTVLQQAQSQVQKLVQAVVKVGDEEEDPNSLDDHNQHHRVVEDLPATVKGSETEAPEKSSWMSSLQHSNLIPRRSVVSALKPSSSPSLKIVKSQVFEDLLRSQQLLQQQSSIILQDIPSASSAFQTHCVTIGLIPKSSQLLWLSKKYIKLSFRLLIWMSIAMAGLEINKQRRAIKRGVTFASKNMRGFVHRRFVMPTMSIVNDVIFNKRTAITDKVALKDAKRSLNRMIYDFLVQH